MSNTPFMQLYVSDYLGDTRHLTTEQHGAYLLLLMCMWRSHGFLPADQFKLARMAGVSARRWHIVGPDVMAFFDVDGDQITQKRLMQEYQKATSKSEKRSVSGKIGAAAKVLKNNNMASANADRLLKHSPESESEEVKEHTTYVPKNEAQSENPKPSPKPKPERGTRLPESWWPDPPLVAFARSKGLTDKEINDEIERFTLHWTSPDAKNPLKRDWGRCWQKWVTSPYRKPSGQTRPGGGQPLNGGIVAGLVRRTQERMAMDVPDGSWGVSGTEVDQGHGGGCGGGSESSLDLDGLFGTSPTGRA